MKHVDIPKMLKNAKTIAVFGLSAKPHRASYEVASYLQQNGYRILPIGIRGQCPISHISTIALSRSRSKF